MRQLRVEFAAGQDLFEAYWNFLQSGGVVLKQTEGANEGEAIDLRVRIRSLKKEWRFSARVARVADGRAFVAFDPGQAQDAMVNSAWADTYAVPERKHRRFDVRADVRYATAQARGAERPATLTNLSRGGCCIETDERLPVGTVLRVVGPGIVTDAKVRWVRSLPSRELGLEFAQPLEPSVLIP